MSFNKGVTKNIYIALFTLIISACSPHSINYNPFSKVEPLNEFSLSNDPMDNSDVWWSEFKRPELDVLINNAFLANQDLAQALARIKQAQAITKQTRSTLYPQVNIEANIGDRWQDGNSQSTSADIGGILEWELDIFNRIGGAAEADQLTAVARMEGANAVRLSLSAEIANAYFGSVSANRKLKLLNDQVRTDEDLLELLQLRMDNGIGTNVEVLQQKSRVADSESLIPSTEADLRVFENRLDVLLGQMPDSQNRIQASETLDITKILPSIGVPSDLLLNRPDLRVARAELIAADADIAAAIADRLPRVTLDGSYMYSDTASFVGPVGALMGSLIQPLLDWGQRKAEVERNKALYEEELAAFTQLYLEAVEDVENAFYQETKQREFVKRLEQRRDLLNKTMEETEARYTQGIDDYLPVLNALQELRNVERDLIAERLNLVNFRIALHRAVGGNIKLELENDTPEMKEKS